MADETKETKTKLERLQALRKQAHIQNISAAKAKIAQAQAMMEEAKGIEMITEFKIDYDIDLNEQVNVDALIKAEKEREETELKAAKERAKPLQLPNGA